MPLEGEIREAKPGHPAGMILFCMNALRKDGNLVC